MRARWLIALSLLVLPAYARAQTAAPASSTGAATSKAFSKYESETLSMALPQVRGELEPAPEGKTLEGIEVVTFEVFDDREGVLQIANVFHATTLPAVLRREVLLRVGQPYSRELADETARNLRGFPQNSLVLVVALKGSRPNTVRLLVVTKDVWSLRLSWDLKVSSAGLDLLRLEPTETNLAGTHQAVAARFILRPETYTFGTGFRVPRVQGHRVSAGADANVTFNKASGEPEGSYGSTYVMRPLFSARTEWSWLVSNDWRQERVRRYIDTRVGLFNARITPERDALRDEYLAQRFTETIAVTRSFGLDHKQDISLGGEVNRRAFRLPPLVAARYPAEVLDEYRRVRLPRSDTRVGPALRARFYENRFMRQHDFETLGLQEDYRLGYDVTLKGYPVFEELGATRSFVGTYAAVQYTWALGDGVFRLGGELLNEFEENRIADAAVSSDVRIHSPSLGFGRIVFDAGVLNRYRNYLNRTTLLGGETRLRGYPTSFFSGKDYVVANLEYRTPSFNLGTIFLGGAAFFDAGHAFDGWDELRPQQSTGAGLRILFPQLDRVVFRVDFAVPLTNDLPTGVSRYGSLWGIPVPTFFGAFEQAFAFSSTGGSLGPTQGSSAGLLGQ